MIGAVKDALKTRNLPYREQVVTATFCTFRIGGPAQLVIEPRCVGELVEAVTLCVRANVPFAVIGKGSNLLFDDGEISTVLIRTVALDAVRTEKGGIHALCGVPLARLAQLAAQIGFSDLCFAAGIPGTLGGGLYMNAGAYGSSMLPLVEWVRILDTETLEITTLFNEKLSNIYRNSVFRQEKSVILDATLKLQKGAENAEILEKMKRLSAARRAAQPLDLPSAGSVFRRPSPEIALSKILDELGFKGRRMGGAEVSRKHAGFIVNTGNATARDVRALILEIQNTVERECGFRPGLELELIPKDV